MDQGGGSYGPLSQRKLEKQVGTRETVLVVPGPEGTRRTVPLVPYFSRGGAFYEFGIKNIQSED